MKNGEELKLRIIGYLLAVILFLQLCSGFISQSRKQNENKFNRQLLMMVQHSLLSIQEIQNLNAKAFLNNKELQVWTIQDEDLKEYKEIAESSLGVYTKMNKLDNLWRTIEGFLNLFIVLLVSIVMWLYGILINNISQRMR
jgi:hypothetical protein